MKRIVPFLLIVIFVIALILGTIPVQAEEVNKSNDESEQVSTSTSQQSNADIEVMLEGPEEVKDDKFTMTLKIGKLTNIEEGSVIAFDTNLECTLGRYESINITELNGWSITYSNETQRIVGMVDEVKENTEIAKLEFTLKDEVKNVKETIRLTNFNISDDLDLEKTIDNISKEDIMLRKQYEMSPVAIRNIIIIITAILIVIILIVYISKNSKKAKRGKIR